MKPKLYELTPEHRAQFAPWKTQLAMMTMLRRRVMIDRYGPERYIMDLGAERVQADDYGELFRVELENDEAIVMVMVDNSTPEPDGSIKKYMIRVPPTITSAREAIAWTFGIEKANQYAPVVET